MTVESDGGQLVGQGGDPNQIEIWTEMVALERERIASRDRATAVMEAGFANLDAADERQFRFQTDRLQRDDEYRNRRLSYAVRFVWCGVILGTVLIALFVWAILWGSADQRAAAFTSVSVVGALGAGTLLGRYIRAMK